MACFDNPQWAGMRDVLKNGAARLGLWLNIKAITYDIPNIWATEWYCIKSDTIMEFLSL